MRTRQKAAEKKLVIGIYVQNISYILLCWWIFGRVHSGVKNFLVLLFAVAVLRLARNGMDLI